MTTATELTGHRQQLPIPWVAVLIAGALTLGVIIGLALPLIIPGSSDDALARTAAGTNVAVNNMTDAVRSDALARTAAGTNVAVNNMTDAIRTDALARTSETSR